MANPELSVPPIDKALLVPIQRPPVTEITTLEDANRISIFDKECGKRIKEIEATAADMKSLAFRTHKAICAAEKASCAPFVEGQSWASSVLTAWHIKEENRRLEEQRRLDEEARKQAADEARANGEKLLAKQIESGKVAVVSETVVATPVKIQGFTTTDTWDVAVVSPMILLRSILQGKYPVAWVYFDLKAMSDAVKRASGSLKIEGCAVRKVTSGRRTR